MAKKRCLGVSEISDPQASLLLAYDVASENFATLQNSGAMFSSHSFPSGQLSNTTVSGEAIWFDGQTGVQVSRTGRAVGISKRGMKSGNRCHSGSLRGPRTTSRCMDPALDTPALVAYISIVWSLKLPTAKDINFETAFACTDYSPI